MSAIWLTRSGNICRGLGQGFNAKASIAKASIAKASIAKAPICRGFNLRRLWFAKTPVCERSIIEPLACEAVGR
jgi:hypothetical protein